MWTHTSTQKYDCDMDSTVWILESGDMLVCNTSTVFYFLNEKFLNAMKWKAKLWNESIHTHFIK